MSAGTSIKCKECGMTRMCKMDCGSKSKTKALQGVLDNLSSYSNEQLGVLNFEMYVLSMERSKLGDE